MQKFPMQQVYLKYNTKICTVKMLIATMYTHYWIKVPASDATFPDRSDVDVRLKNSQFVSVVNVRHTTPCVDIPFSMCVMLLVNNRGRRTDMLLAVAATGPV
jgi:hypothetical protein